MSFNKMFFNSEAPTMRTRIGYLGLALVFAGFFAGVWIDFVTSPDWYYPLVLLACPAIALAHGALIWSGARAEGRLGTMSGVLIPLCGVVMLAALYMPTVTKTIPYLVTQASGEDYAETLSMHTQGSRRKRSCDHRLTGGPMGDLFSRHLCISEATYLQFPDQPVAVAVSGRRGALGKSIDHIHSVQPLELAR